MVIIGIVYILIGAILALTCESETEESNIDGMMLSILAFWPVYLVSSVVKDIIKKDGIAILLFFILIGLGINAKTMEFEKMKRFSFLWERKL